MENARTRYIRSLRSQLVYQRGVTRALRSSEQKLLKKNSAFLRRICDLETLLQDSMDLVLLLHSFPLTREKQTKIDRLMEKIKVCKEKMIENQNILSDSLSLCDEE